jgi:hypothetical protein
MELPKKITDILNTYDEDADPYHEARRLVSELEKVGWTAEWGLSGELYDLKPLSIIPLKSVGCYIDTKTWIVYPKEENSQADLHNGVHLNDCTDEWLSKMSTSDLLTIAHKL